MPFQDVINEYTPGATGTIATTDGGSVGYTVSGTSANQGWNGDPDGARVNGDGSQALEIGFDKIVTGTTVIMSGSDAAEHYFFVIDGVQVDMNTLVANGDVTITQTGAQTHTVNPDGSISGGHHSDGSVAEIQFNIPMDSIRIFGSGASAGNWDFFEVGINSASFTAVCFTRGTRIETKSGQRLIQNIKVGDKVMTANGVYQKVRWIGSTKVSAKVLSKDEKLRPIRIVAGALGHGLPKRDLLVSRQHRMLVSSEIAYRVCGATDVLVPAFRLTELPGIFPCEETSEVEYFHILFDDHEVIFAEGAPSESLLTGPEALKAVSPTARAEILGLFPELKDLDYEAEPAAFIPSPKAQKRLAARHVQNDKAVLEALF